MISHSVWAFEIDFFHLGFAQLLESVEFIFTKFMRFSASISSNTFQSHILSSILLELQWTNVRPFLRIPQVPETIPFFFFSVYSLSAVQTGLFLLSTFPCQREEALPLTARWEEKSRHPLRHSGSRHSAWLQDGAGRLGSSPGSIKTTLAGGRVGVPPNPLWGASPDTIVKGWHCDQGAVMEVLAVP